MKILLAMTVTLALMPFAGDVARAEFTVVSVLQSGSANAVNRSDSFSETLAGTYKAEVEEDRGGIIAQESLRVSLNSSVQITGETISLSAKAEAGHGAWGSDGSIPVEQWGEASGSTDLHFSIATPHLLELMDSHLWYDGHENFAGFGSLGLSAISIPLETLPDEFRNSIWDNFGGADPSSDSHLNFVNSFVFNRFLYPDFNPGSIALPPGAYRLSTYARARPDNSDSPGGRNIAFGNADVAASISLTAIVPEPSPAFLLMVGASLLAARRSRE